MFQMKEQDEISEQLSEVYTKDDSRSQKKNRGTGQEDTKNV